MESRRCSRPPNPIAESADWADLQALTNHPTRCQSDTSWQNVTPNIANQAFGQVVDSTIAQGLDDGEVTTSQNMTRPALSEGSRTLSITWRPTNTKTFSPRRQGAKARLRVRTALFRYILCTSVRLVPDERYQTGMPAGATLSNHLIEQGEAAPLGTHSTDRKSVV